MKNNNIFKNLKVIGFFSIIVLVFLVPQSAAAVCDNCSADQYCGYDDECHPKKNNIEECNYSVECLSGKCFCLLGTESECYCGECYDDLNCSPTEYCMDWECHPKKSDGENCIYDNECMGECLCISDECHCDLCYGDSDCLDTEYCGDDNKCRPKKNNTAVCSYDNECLSDHCIDNKCQIPTCGEDICTDSEYCENNECKAKKVVGETCTGDNQCTSSYCIGHKCKVPTCGDEICAEYEHCGADNTCQPKKDNNIACTIPNECKSGYCIDNKCQAPTCGDDVCDDTEYCEDDECKAKKSSGSECTGNNQCQSSYCNNGFCCDSGTCCGSDRDCSATQTCNIASHQCHDLKCPAGKEAENHQCVDITGYCASNADCADDERCAGNNCAPLNCPAGKRMENHQCVTIPGYCTSDNTCEGNESCAGNICTPLNCSEGEQAENHQCQQISGGMPAWLVGVIAAIMIITILSIAVILLWKRPSKIDLTANPTEIPADENSVSSITIAIKNIFGKPFGVKTDIPVTLSTTGGKISSQVTILNGDTSATAVLTSSQTPGAVTVTASAGNLTNSTDVTYIPAEKKPIKKPAKKRHCMHCGAQMLSESDPCPRCGKLPPSGVDTKSCHNCNRLIPSVAKFCPRCGKEQPE